MLWVARNKTGGSTQEKVVCCRTLRLRAPKGSPNGLLSDRPTAGCTNRLRGTSRLPVCDGLLPALNHSKKKITKVCVLPLCVLSLFQPGRGGCRKVGPKEKATDSALANDIASHGKRTPSQKNFKPQLGTVGNLENLVNIIKHGYIFKKRII